MRQLSDEFIDDYLLAIGDAAFSSPGSYQIEGLGAHLFSSIEGCSYVVLGLPLLQVLAFLRTTGWQCGGRNDCCWPYRGNCHGKIDDCRSVS